MSPSTLVRNGRARPAPLLATIAIAATTLGFTLSTDHGQLRLVGAAFAADDADGQRVRTLAGIARELGLTGASQANWSTPQANGVYGQTPIGFGPAHEINPGEGQQSEWVLKTLDVNGDGTVDEDDLTAAQNGVRPADLDQTQG